MAWPTLTIEVGFDAGPTEASPTWEDITNDVLEFRTSRGRQSSIDRMQPGTAELTLDNADRAYDPEHSGGPHYGDLLPGRQVRIVADSTKPLARAAIGGWPQQYRHPRWANTPTSATDAFEWLSEQKWRGSPAATAITQHRPHHWYRFAGVDAALWEMVPDNGSGGVDGEWRGGGFIEPQVLDLSRGDDATGCPHFGYLGLGLSLLEQIDWSGGVVLVIRYANPLAGFFGTPDPLWLFYQDGAGVQIDASTGELKVLLDSANYTETTGAELLDGETHTIVISEWQSPGYTISIDGSTATTTDTSGSGSVPEPEGGTFVGYTWVGFVAHAAFWTSTFDDSTLAANLWDAISGAWGGDSADERIDRTLDLFGWPTGLRDLQADPDITFGQPGELSDSAISYCQEIVDSVAGRFWQAPDGDLTFRHRRGVIDDTVAWVISDDETDPTAWHYEALGLTFDRDRIINVVDVTWTGGTVRVVDQASVDAYGERSHSITTALTTVHEATALADWIIDRHAEPRMRADAVVLNPAVDHDLFTLALGVEIGDLVTVRRHPQDIGTAVQFDAVVEGVSHDVGEGVGRWLTTLYVARTPTEPTWWKWGTGAWGTSTRWVF